MVSFIQEYFNQMPIITKSFMFFCALTTLCVHLDVVNIHLLYLNFDLVWARLEVLPPCHFPHAVHTHQLLGLEACNKFSLLW